MRKEMKKLLTSIVFIAMILTISFIWNFEDRRDRVADASVQQSETVNLRIIGTTDLHGQLSSKDYEQGIDMNMGGLSKVFSLIEKARGELPKENTVTLDAGDVLYDYTTEYIFSENQNEIQPIYRAMAMMGYDAITLGNHEFDYGYEYLLRQLNGSGLRNIAVVSNVFDSKTDEYPFLENMLLTRKMKTKSGKVVEIKIGIIGQTIPNLTAKTHSYAGILKTEDMVINAEKQAKKLKEMGANVIIALSHTGIGPEKPELNFKNVAYALTKIPEIDVVVCGHEHNLFPTSDMTSAYYKLPGVNKTTYLMNGKNVVMAGDRGKAIGVVDLTLNVTGSQVAIADRKSELRFTSNDIPSNAMIHSFYGEWEEKLLRYTTEVIGELEEGVVIQNYYGLLTDNTAIQLLNDSKLYYASKYIGTVGKKYKNYPIIAASTYSSYGVASVEDFINIQKKITESHLAEMQMYNNYLYLYKITGKQLKEWLEWSASAYETIHGNVNWKNTTMLEMMNKSGIKSLISENWLDDWNHFYVFDGIHYEIDPSVSPRYDFSGNRINNSNRITKVTYNGVEITDSQVFVIATDKITKPTGANSGVEQQKILGGFNRGQANLSEYIKQALKGSSLVPQVDYNWRVNLPSGYKFIIKTPYYADKLFKQTNWYVDTIGEKDKYNYYSAIYPAENNDQMAPHIVLAPTKFTPTGQLYPVTISVTDASEIKRIKFLEGKYDTNYIGWPAASSVLDLTFYVYKNGLYSIYAEDIHGNKSVKVLKVDNIKDDMLGTPTVETYTNRKSSIKGTAEPGTTIFFEAYTGTYESKVSMAGTFSYALPSQPSGTEVIVYIVDEKKGLESERITIPVKRTGPNQPSVNPVTNNVANISGDTNDEDASIIIKIEDAIYVSNKGGLERYLKATEIYDPSYQVIEVKLDILDKRFYNMEIPVQDAGKTITVYTIDHLSRISRANSIKVTELAPNAPVVYEVSNIERTLTGYIPNNKNQILEVTMILNNGIYQGKTDNQGKFSFSFTDQLHSGDIITIFANDVKGGVTRTSYQRNVIVNDIQKYVKANSTNLTLSKVTHKSSFIVGYYGDKGTVTLAITEGSGKNFKSTLYTVETDYEGKFMYRLEQKLNVGAKIYAMIRFTDGNITLVNMTEVLPGRPNTPTLQKEVTNTDKTVSVIADKDCEVVLTIGKKTYKTKKYLYDETANLYIYTLTIDREVSGTELTITATNIAGTSDVYKSKVVKAAPENPQVNTIKAGNILIKGKIELYDYKLPATIKVSTKIEKLFKDAPKKVASTQTRIFAQIGSKVYEGTISNNGTYEIKIPKQKAGVKIKVWGTNKAGRGPSITVVVVK